MWDSSTPTRALLRLPAERCTHLRTLMAWPDDTFDDNADDLFFVRREIASIANTIAKYESVWMYASHQNVPSAQSYISSNVTIVNVTVNQPWLRDTGPVLVFNSESGESLTGINLNFNFWGGNVVVPMNSDRTLSRRLLERNDITQISTSISTEGGALEVDGEGTLLATESSLLNANRNGEKGKFGMEENFRELLGIKKTIWLEGVKGLDKTDYHINRLARFGPNSNTVLLSRPHESVPPSDPRYTAYE